MPAYVIADVDVHDPDAYEEYKKGTPASAAEFGGRFVVRGGEVEVREGTWEPNRLVVLEFPDLDAARSWYDSDGYRALRELRTAASTANLIIVDGAS